MPNAVLNITENSANIIPFPPKRKFCFEQMTSSENTISLDNLTDEVDNNTHKGMDNFPADVYNQMIEYSLDNGKIRNAMLMICMANWGMRFSDVVRVRFGYLFNREGHFKEAFSLPNGEKKTKKSVLYYNNEATEKIIGLYLDTVEKNKSRLDYLFTSESGNTVKATLQELEAEDLYDGKIETTSKELLKIPDTEKRLLEKYIEGKITDDNFEYMSNIIKQNKKNLETQLENLIKAKENYISKTPDADKIYLCRPISHTTGENIIKETLKEIGINPRNRKDKSEKQTTSNKYNTHSMRKTFADWFITTGDRLNNSGELAFNDTVMDLLKEKFKHSSKSVTTHYTNAQEEAFKLICQNLNIGLDVLEKYEDNYE